MTTKYIKIGTVIPDANMQYFAEKWDPGTAVVASGLGPYYVGIKFQANIECENELSDELLLTHVYFSGIDTDPTATNNLVTDGKLASDTYYLQYSSARGGAVGAYKPHDFMCILSCSGTANVPGHLSSLNRDTMTGNEFGADTLVFVFKHTSTVDDGVVAGDITNVEVLAYGKDYTISTAAGENGLYEGASTPNYATNNYLGYTASGVTIKTVEE